MLNIFYVLICHPHIFFGKMYVKYFTHFLNWMFVLLMCFKTSLCILGTSTLLICKYFSYASHFNSLNNLFGILNFEEVQFTSFLNGSIFAIKSKKYLPTSMSLRFSLEVV